MILLLFYDYSSSIKKLNLNGNFDRNLTLSPHQETSPSAVIGKIEQIPVSLNHFPR